MTHPSCFHPVEKLIYWNKMDPAQVDKILKILKKIYPEANCALVHENPLQLLVSTILSAQSLVSRITKSDHTFLAGLQSNEFRALLSPRTLLLLLLLPACFLINLLLYFSKKGEVIFVVAEKNQN